MAQESFDSPFDSLSRKTTNQLAQGEADTSAIKREIARTRAEMSETRGEIQDRLRPDHLLEQARENVTQAAAGKVRTIMRSAGETASTVATRARDAGDYLTGSATAHPIQVAVTVGALTWWMLRGRDRSYVWDGAADTQWDDAEDMVYSDGRSLRSTVGEYAASARDTVGEYAASARETVGEYAQSARETVGAYAAGARDAAADVAGHARDAAGEYAQSARSAARRASTRVVSAASSATTTADEWVHQNPLAAGAIALAVGAAIGLSIPRTEIEDNAMGPARDRAVEKASRLAKNLTENVTDKVATAAENLVSDSIVNAPPATPGEPLGRA